MSDVPDLGKIKPPDQPPIDQPDPKTSDENEENKKKARTPGERADEAHRRLLDSLGQRIAERHGECEQLRAEVVVLRKQLADEQQETKGLAIACAVLRTGGCAVICMTAIGNFLSLLGSILIGVAGSVSTLTDAQKMLLTGSGAALAVSGALFVAASYVVNWWTQPKG